MGKLILLDRSLSDKELLEMAENIISTLMDIIEQNQPELYYISDDIARADDWLKIYHCEDDDAFEIPTSTVPFLWEKLGDVAINEDEEIEEDFFKWKKGTSRYEIWHWFDEMLPDGLGRFLNKE